MLGIWNGLKISFIIVGTTIGAGYASGREIWEFFGSYGSRSSYFILVSMLLFALSCYVIMELSYKLRANHYVYVLEELTGKFIAHVYDLLIFFYLISTTVVMLAGSGATLEYWSIPYWLGVILTAVFVLIIFLRDVEAFINLNSLLIPMLIIILLLVCTLFLWQTNGQPEISVAGQFILPSALAFTALNIMPLIAVLSALGSRMSRLEIKVASISSALILCVISVLFNQSLLKVGHDVLLHEIPLFAILRYFPPYFMVLVSLMLLVAIYTTAISNMFGLVTRLNERISLAPPMIVLMLMLFMVPLTKFGFANLIKILYPLYGVLNLFILATILLYPLQHWE